MAESSIVQGTSLEDGQVYDRNMYGDTTDADNLMF